MEDKIKENLEEKEANENISSDVSEDLKKCQAELDDTTDRLKRIMAEFEKACQEVINIKIGYSLNIED